MKHRTLVLAALVLLVGVRPLSGTIIDQQVPSFDVAFAVGPVYQQEVIAGVTGQLMGFDIAPAMTGYSARAFVNLGAPWQADPNDFETLFTSTVQYDWQFIDTSAANIYLSSGESFVIGIGGPYSGFYFWGAIDSHYPGALYFDGTPSWPPTWDIAFRTHVIPEPSMLVLLSIGGACLPIYAWRRRKRPHGG